MTPRNRMLLSVTLAALATSAGVTAYAQSAPVAASALERIRPDANGDGNLARAEAMAAAEARFARMDANADGRIDQADRAAGRERRREAMFTVMDANRDGSVTRAEFDAAGEAMDARRAERRDARAERGGEGRRMHRMRGERRGAQMAMARMADTNNDRAIDRAEFMAAAEARFARADADRNGVVTASERQALRGDRAGRRGRHGMTPPPPPSAEDE